MNTKDAYTLLEALMDGINPITGELLPSDHVCQEPAVLRALHKALMVLRSDADMRGDDPAPLNRDGRLNAGRLWTQKDLDWLKQLHEAGTPIDEMCHLLQRRKRGIEKQLAYLGLIDTQRGQPAVNPKCARAGMPWTAADDKVLWDMWERVCLRILLCGRNSLTLQR